MQETTKAYLRRKNDKFWDRVFKGNGIDIGSGDDPFKEEWFTGIKSIKPFDLEDGDAQFLSRYVGSESFDFVHSSNCLEHMHDPVGALSEWCEVLKPNGYLVFTVPDEDLYEQGIFPSRWNGDHKVSFTIWKNDSWCDKSMNISELVSQVPGMQVKKIELVDTNYDYSRKNYDQTYHSNAECFIEVVLWKNPVLAYERVGTKEIERTFKHSGARGDLIYGLCAMKALGGGELYINLDAKHHYVGVGIDENDVKWFKELLISHDYVDDVQVWDGRDVGYDLDNFRDFDIDANLLSWSHLNRFKAEADLSLPWLEMDKIPKIYEGDIVISRSARYHGFLDWGELKGWEDRCVFIGMQEEWEDFRKNVGLHIQYRPVSSYIEMAGIIAASKLFIGNQSFPYSLAEAMKANRVLEVCISCPNCDPQSDNGHVRLTQNILNHYVVKERELKEFEKETRSHNPWKLSKVRVPVMQKPGLWERIKSPQQLKDRPLVSVVVCALIGKEDDIQFMDKNINDCDLIKFLQKDRDLEESVIAMGTIKTLATNINNAALLANGDYIAIVDANTTLSPGWSSDMRDCFVDESVGIVGTERSFKKTPHMKFGCLMIARRAYEACGLFSTKIDDWNEQALDLAVRYGKQGYGSRQSSDRSIEISSHIKEYYEVKNDY